MTRDLFALLSPLFVFYDHAVLIYFVLLNTFYVLLFIVSILHLIQNDRREQIPFSRSFLKSPMMLPVSILVPAYNEDKVIVDSLRSLLALHYSLFEVIVVNDGSKDRTLEVLRQAFDLSRVNRIDPGLLPTQRVRGAYASPSYPNLLVIDKENGGKPDALNCCINLSRSPLFCTVDADSVLEPEALVRVVKPFLRDHTVVAVGGVVRISNGNHIRQGYIKRIRLRGKPIVLFQVIEYLRAFFTGRLGWSGLNSLFIISGAFGVFKKDVVLRCGGYRTDTVGEDMDLVVRMHRLLRDAREAYKMVFIPDPVCWTEAPESWKVLWMQRDRWQRGLAQSLQHQLGMFFNPRYGAIGMVAMPYFVIFEMFGPLVEFGGYVCMTLSMMLGLVNWPFAKLFFAAAVLFGILLSVGAVISEEMSFRRYPKLSHLLILILAAILENFGYRQLNAGWRCWALFKALWGKGNWGTMTRRGFATAAVLVTMVAAAGSLAAVPPPVPSAEHARALLSAGKAAEALPELQMLVAETPNNLDLRADLAEALAWTNHYTEAESQYQGILKKNPTHREALLGLARLRGYQNRDTDSLALLDRGLLAYPGDKEFIDEKKIVLARCGEKACEGPYRYQMQGSYTYEKYSFVNPGSIAALSLQDHRFHGWDAGVDVAYDHRFGFDDADLGMSAAHLLPWHHAYAGFTLGGATEGHILPTARTSFFGGVPIAAGWSSESSVSYRHYANANVYSLDPGFTWEGHDLMATVGYSLTNAYYTTDSASGWLGSYHLRLGLERWCEFKPWLGYERTKEAFEEGLVSGAQNFTSNYYEGGMQIWLGRGWSLLPSYSYEDRPGLHQFISRWQTALSYSWGAR